MWDSKKNKAFDEVRQRLRAMCPGAERCMYCDDSAGTDIEHFYPKSDYPLAAFSWLNDLIACATCNSNYKRDQFPLDDSGQPLLVNPVDEDPRDHLQLSPSTGKVVPLTVKGEKSRDIFGLDRDVLEKARRGSWTSFKALIRCYADA